MNKKLLVVLGEVQSCALLSDLLICIVDLTYKYDVINKPHYF